MNKIDRHNQIRLYIFIQLISVWDWYLIFFMLLDIIVINVFLVYRDLYEYIRLKYLNR